MTENSPIMKFTITGRQVEIRNDSDINLSNVHVCDEIDDILNSIYDNNFDNKISSQSGASVFLQDIKQIIGKDNKITDEEIEAFIKEKDIPFVDVAKVKQALLQLFSSKENTPFEGKLRKIKIGDKVIYIGEKITQEIDTEQFRNLKTGYINNNFILRYTDRKTRKISTTPEADKLRQDLEALCDENGEISEEKLNEYIKANPKLKDVSTRMLTEYFNQILAPKLTNEEKQAYFKSNKQKLDNKLAEYNLLDQVTDNKDILIAQDIVHTFREKYGTPMSSSMDMILQKEYYQSGESGKRISALRHANLNDVQALSEWVRKNNAANCSEDATLSNMLMKQKYPDKKTYQISLGDSSGFGDVGHVAILILDDDALFGDQYSINDKNMDLSTLQSKEIYKHGYVIDNWFKGVFKADDWIKMQMELHNSSKVDVSMYEDY